MRAKLSNYCLTWEQLYLAETPWVVEEKRGKGREREREKLGPVPALPSFSLPPRPAVSSFSAVAAAAAATSLRDLHPQSSRDKVKFVSKLAARR